MVDIAIIGAGIGGLGLAHYLKSEMTSANITVFERKGRIGGRIQSSDINGFNVEIGAVYYHSTNELTSDLVEELELPVDTLDRQPFGIWDGNKFVLNQGRSEFWENLKLVFRYQLSLYRMMKLVKLFKSNVNQIYDTPIDFTSIEEMLSIMGSKTFANNTLEEILKKYKVKNKIINELVIPTTRYVYHHSGSRNMNAFAGLVSMIAYDRNPVYYLENGNQQICEKIITKHELEVKTNHMVQRIFKQDQKYVVNTDKTSDPFDIVIIACPLSISGINIEGIEVDINDTQYESYYKTIVVGDIKPEYFNVETIGDIPAMILTQPNETFQAFGLEKVGTNERNQTIYELTSTKKLSSEFLEDLFATIHSKKAFFQSYTFPYLEPTNSYDPIIIDNNLYYLGAIDLLSPTLESSLIVARAIANNIMSSDLV